MLKKKSLERALRGDAITEKETNSLWEMFIDCNFIIVPTIANITEITLTAANFAFIQKVFLALTKIRKRLGSFCDEFSVVQTDLLWNPFKPTTANCLSYFNFDEAISTAEKKGLFPETICIWCIRGNANTATTVFHWSCKFDSWELYTSAIC